MEMENTEEGNSQYILQKCRCENMNVGKSGKRKRFSFRDLDWHCTNICNCGKKFNGEIVKICKNRMKKQQKSNAERIESQIRAVGFGQMENEIKKAKEEIQEIVSKLDSNLVVEVSGIGAGSPDYVRNLITIINEDDTDVNNENASQFWCVCGVCIEMPTIEENKYCERASCITSYVKFPKVCLDKDVLKIAIIDRADYRAEEVNFRNSDYRKAAYYQFCLWRYGKLGKGNRRVLPSCVVKLIRTRYPKPKGTYMGFRSS